MKKVVTILCLLFIAANAFSQSMLSENEKLASLGKVWGFLKYYHPIVAKGKVDWDKELTTHVQPVLSANSKEELSGIYISWLHSLGSVKAATKTGKHVPDTMKLNLDLRWLNDKTVFTDSLVSMLHVIEHSARKGKNYYAQKAYDKGHAYFKNEEPYKDSVYPAIGFRLLALFRYWNCINYYYPYKYLLDQDWNTVLTEMIPAFAHPVDTVSYHLAMKELVVKLSDSHAFYSDKYTVQFLGAKYPGFTYSIIEDKVMVTGYHNDSLAMQDDILYGDVILSVDGKPIEQILATGSRYITGSNAVAKRRFAGYKLLNGNTDTAIVILERSGASLTRAMHRYPPYLALKTEHKKEVGAVSKIVDSNIGYIDMGLLKRKHVRGTMMSLMHTDAIIVDSRNYPQWTVYPLMRFLNPVKKTFVKYTNTLNAAPGLFTYYKTARCGKKNRNYYKGKLIVLFNEDTQSQAEFTCMALQTAPNVTCIGSQTAGTDGGVCTITFPGGRGTWMTHEGIYYPDGRISQRIGIVPDIKVTPTVGGMRSKQDEVLDRAIEFVRTGK